MASSNVDDLITELKRVSDEILAAISNSKVNPNQVQLTKLSELSTNLGLIRAGEFRSGNQKEPGSGFSGVRMAYPSVWYNGNWWNIVGIENDNLEFGLRASDGVAVFASGQALMDSDALKISGLTYGFQHTATNAGNQRTAKIGLFLPSGSAVPAFQLTYQGPVGSSNMVTNGDAEAGSITGWTDASSAWSASTISPYAGVYSFRHDATNVGCPAQLIQNVGSIVAGTYYEIDFASKLASGEFTPFVQLNWKNGGGTVIQTDYVYGTNTASWSAKSQIIKAPASVASVDIILDPGDPFGDTYFDGISLFVAGVTRSLYFQPDLTYSGGSFIVGTSALATSATDGFIYIPTCAGTPTGVPTGQTGTVPMVYDTTNNKLYVYNGAWKSVTLA